MLLESILIVILGFGVTLVIAFLVSKNMVASFHREREREKELLEEKLKQGESNLEHKKDSIKELVDKIRDELGKSQRRLDNTERERVGEFRALKAVLDEYKLITGGLKESTDNLKNLLSNNQLRGRYGEEVAENLLQSVGFVKGQNYLVNKAQGDNNRPDFTILLPDKTKINVDSKFPLGALLKYQEAENTEEKKFEIDYTAPFDPSGIIGAWYKLGSAPEFSEDGTYTTEKPFTVASLEEKQNLYVWLQNRDGRANHAAHKSIELALCLFRNFGRT